MLLKLLSYLLSYPLFRVDRFTEVRESIPASLLPRDPQENRDDPGPCEDFEGLNLRVSRGELHSFPSAWYYLLTHFHTDRLSGLASSQHNGAPIYCSKETKEMLLRYETRESRKAGDQGAWLGQGDRKRKYKELCVSDKEAAAARQHKQKPVSAIDRLHVLTPNKPQAIQYSPQMKTKLTLIDANHMPGSVMFLIEGPRGAELHMGHCRAEKWWLEALIRNPAMWHYVRGHNDSDHGDNDDDGARLRLRNIYVDDKCLAFGESAPGKLEAARDLVRLMRMYPSDTIFFIDDWTHGYEEVLQAIVGEFGARIHVSKYKLRMYQAAGSPLVDFLTTDANVTRFHACSRIDGCDHFRTKDLTQVAAEIEAWQSLSQPWHAPPPPLPLSREDMDHVQQSLAERASQATPLYVVVKMIEASEQSWAELQEKSRAKIEAAKRGEAPYPSFLGCPIQRHSTMLEMLNFVRTFRPATITPTTWDPDRYYLTVRHLRWALKEEGRARLEEEAKRVMGLGEWQKREECLNTAEGNSEQRTVADELKALRKTRLDLRQATASQQQQLGDGGAVNTNTSAPAAQVVDTPASSISAINLDDHLAQRYFFVLRNHVKPGVEVVNLPGDTEGPQAWRAVRALAPALAIATEDLMKKERQVAPPAWSSCPIEGPASPAEARRTSGVRVKPTCGLPVYQGSPRRRSLPKSQDASTSASASPFAPSKRARSSSASSNSSSQGDEQQQASASTSAPAFKRTKRGGNNDGTDDDWLQRLLPLYEERPLRFSADLCSDDQGWLAAAHAHLERQASDFAKILEAGNKRVDGRCTTVEQLRALSDLVIDALGIFGGVQGSGMKPGEALRPETLLRLCALTDNGLQVVLVVFAEKKDRGVPLADAKMTQLKISLHECAKGVEALLTDLQGQDEACGSKHRRVCGGTDWTAEKRAESTVLLKRLQKTLGMVEKEARR